MADIPEEKKPPVQPAQPVQTEEHEFSSRNVRSNIAPIFHILQSEQLILQRTDQKAFTLMSILGVFISDLQFFIFTSDVSIYTLLFFGGLDPL